MESKVRSKEIWMSEIVWRWRRTYSINWNLNNVPNSSWSSSCCDECWYGYLYVSQFLYIVLKRLFGMSWRSQWVLRKKTSYLTYKANDRIVNFKSLRAVFENPSNMWGRLHLIIIYSPIASNSQLPSQNGWAWIRLLISWFIIP